MKMECKRLGLGNPRGLRGRANLAPSAPRQDLRAWQPDSEKTQGQRIWVGPAAWFPQGTRGSDFGSQLRTTEKLILVLGSSHDWELLDFYLLLLEPHHTCILPSGLREGRGGPD